MAMTQMDFMNVGSGGYTHWDERDLNLSASSQTVSGLGFKPKTIIAIGGYANTGSNQYLGGIVYDETNKSGGNLCLRQTTSTSYYYDSTECITADSDGYTIKAPASYWAGYYHVIAMG